MCRGQQKVVPVVAANRQSEHLGDVSMRQKFLAVEGCVGGIIFSHDTVAGSVRRVQAYWGSPISVL